MSKDLKTRLREKKEKIEAGGGNFNYFLQTKPGRMRMRLVPVGEDNDWGLEIIHFYPSKEIGGIISPASFGEKCALNALYEKLMAGSSKDKEIAKKMNRKKKYVSLAYRFKDEEGKEPDVEAGVKPLLYTKDPYLTLLDEFLEDTGDFTHPLEGFDVIFMRKGTGQMDTKYTAKLAKKSTKCLKAFRGPYNLEEEIRKTMPSYDQTKEIRDKWLNGSSTEEGSKSSGKKKKKKKKDL